MKHNKSSWSIEEANEAYAPFKNGMTEGRAALVLWADIQEPAGFLSTVKMISRNFVDGIGIPLGDILETKDSMDAAIGFLSGEGKLGRSV